MCHIHMGHSLQKYFLYFHQTVQVSKYVIHYLNQKKELKLKVEKCKMAIIKENCLMILPQIDSYAKKK